MICCSYIITSKHACDITVTYRIPVAVYDMLLICRISLVLHNTKGKAKSWVLLAISYNYLRYHWLTFLFLWSQTGYKVFLSDFKDFFNYNFLKKYNMDVDYACLYVNNIVNVS